MTNSKTFCFLAFTLLGASYADAARFSNVQVDDRGGNLIPYRVRVPNSHESSSSTFPLVLRLHGAGSVGNDLGIGFGPSAGRAEEMITIAPQAPSGTNWNFPTIQSYVKDVLDFESTNLKVDPNRIYVQGFSMGGFGTYGMAQAYPDYFAGASAVAGGGSTIGPQPTEIPFWSFHGDQDTRVSPESGQASVDALRTAGTFVRYTRYPNFTHGRSTDPTETQNVTQKSRSSLYYDWLFSQERGTPHNYELAFDNGTSSSIAGFFDPGSEYGLTARAPDTANGETFVGWTSTAGTLLEHTTSTPSFGTGSFGDPSALTTMFTMPEGDVLVTANYATIPEPSALALAAFVLSTLAVSGLRFL